MIECLTLLFTVYHFLSEYLSLLHNFIYQNLNSGSARVQILLALSLMFVLMRSFGNE